MLADVLTYVLEKTRSQVELRLKDPDNAVLSIFDSSNHQNLFSKLESKNLNQHDYNVFMEFYFSGETGYPLRASPMNPFQPVKRLGFVWIEDFFGLDEGKNATSSTMSIRRS